MVSFLFYIIDYWKIFFIFKIFLEPIVQKFASKLNVTQLLDQDLFNSAHTAIKESSFYLNQSTETRDLNAYAVLLLDSHWDPINKKILLHAALGSGGSSPRLGIFGSHLTHAWPENEDQLISRFTDSRNLDFSQLANDDSTNKYRALDVGIGAFLHEVGHSHGLGIQINIKIFFAKYNFNTKYK